MTEDAKAGSPTVKGMYQLFIGNTTYTLLLAVTAIVVGRILGPSNYGLYTIALIVPPFLFLAIRLGLDSAATRFAARLKSEGKDEEAVSFVYATSIFGVIVATVTSLVFVGLSGWIATSVVNRPQLGTTIIPIAMISVLGQAAFYITDLGMTGLGRFDRAGLLQALQGIVKLLVSVGLVVFGFGVAGAVAGYTVSFVGSGVLGVAYIIWLARGRIPRGVMAEVRRAVRYGFPIYISTLAGGIVAPIINVVLALTVSNSQIGGYALAGTFNALITLFTYPISTALFPLFSSRVDSTSALGDPYRTAMRYTALLVVPIASFIVAFSAPLMVTFYGRAYSFGAMYLALIAATSLLAGVGSLAWGALLNGIGRTQDVLWTTAIGSAVSIASGVGLILVAGVPGAIVGQILGSVVSLAIGTWMVQKRLETGLRLTSVWRFYLASGLVAVLCWPLSWAVHISQVAVIAGAAIYVVLLIPVLALLQALDEADIAALRGYLAFSAMISRPLEVAISYYRASLSVFHQRSSA
jgi:O-antigen/teichoic acid export membrane protein